MKMNKLLKMNKLMKINKVKKIIAKSINKYCIINPLNKLNKSYKNFLLSRMIAFNDIQKLIIIQLQTFKIYIIYLKFICT